jgi:hypothetical protein
MILHEVEAERQGFGHKQISSTAVRKSERGAAVIEMIPPIDDPPDRCRLSMIVLFLLFKVQS